MQVQVLGGDYDYNYVTFSKDIKSVRHTSDTTSNINYGDEIVIHSIASGSKHKLTTIYDGGVLAGRTSNSRVDYDFSVSQPETGSISLVYIYFTTTGKETVVRINYY